MKKPLLIAFGVLVAMMMVAAAFAATSGNMKLKVGDEVFACDCGVKCPCQTMARKAGKCTCGKDMVKAKVVKMGKDMVMLQAKGWDKPRPSATVGKYACACGPKCDCGTISQKAGKCVCGKDMKAVQPMKKGG